MHGALAALVIQCVHHGAVNAVKSDNASSEVADIACRPYSLCRVNIVLCASTGFQHQADSSTARARSTLTAACNMYIASLLMEQ